METVACVVVGTTGFSSCCNCQLLFLLHSKSWCSHATHSVSSHIPLFGGCLWFHPSTATAEISGSMVLVYHLGNCRCARGLSGCKGIPALTPYKCGSTLLYFCAMGNDFRLVHPTDTIFRMAILPVQSFAWSVSCWFFFSGHPVEQLEVKRCSLEENILFMFGYLHGGMNPLLGNTLVVAGTLCIALSIVGEEFCVKKKDQVEVVAMLGVFGVLVCVCEISIFEWNDLASVKWSPTLVALFASYTTASFLYYTLAPFILKMSGATLFYLSLLTTNIWAVLIRIFFYREKVDWLYFVAFAIVAAGLIIYSLNETASGTAITIVDDEAAIQYEPLPEEIAS